MGLQFYNINRADGRNNSSQVKNVIKSTPTVKEKKEKRLTAKNLAYLRTLNVI